MIRNRIFLNFISGSAILLSSAAMIVNCSSESGESALNAEKRSQGLSVSFYNPDDFGSKFPWVGGADGGIAVSPHVAGAPLSCTDNVIEESINGGQFTDVEDSDLNHIGVGSDAEYLQRSLAACGCDETTGRGASCGKKLVNRCITKTGQNSYKINKPNCQPRNQKQLYEIKNEQTGQSAKVFIESTCPSNHWKNVAKAALGVDNNHCAKPHVDISTRLLGKIGIDYSNQNQSSITLTPIK
jgi:hypothetical protein